MSGSSSATPLAGLRIVVTRARAQAENLGSRLTALGALVLYCPAIRLVDPVDPIPFQQAVRRLEEFDWVILSSANGVDALARELERQGRAAEALTRLRIACVGPATAAALRARGAEAAAMPSEFVGAEIAGALEPRIRQGERRILLARAAGGDPELPGRLRAAGASVEEVESYRSVPDPETGSDLRQRLGAGTVDLITFTSSSTVTYLLQAVGGAFPAAVRLAAIGPVTAAHMRALGLSPDIIAGEHTIPGLVDAIVGYYEERNRSERKQ